jgi:hypothetical protein
MNSSSKVREFYEEFIRSYMIGPGKTTDGKWDLEELLNSNMKPMRVYASGIVFPQKLKIESDANLEAANTGGEKSAIDDNQDVINKKRFGRESSSAQQDDFEANRANDYKPSALGISCIIEPIPGIIIQIKGATYSKIITKNPDGDEIAQYKRKPFNLCFEIKEEHLTTLLKERTLEKPESLKLESQIAQASLHLYMRDPGPQTKSVSKTAMLMTATLLNDTSSDGKGLLDNERCIYQCELSITSSKDSKLILAYPEFETQTDQESQSLNMLYRKHKSYAIGHGCAANWSEPDKSSKCESVWTECMPRYELAPTVPTQLEGVPLLMKELGEGDAETIAKICNKLCDKYSAWINNLKEKSLTLPDKHQGAANKHISACKETLRRMTEGVKLLSSDNNCLRAFQWANEAMIEQQKHYKISTDYRREWEELPNGDIKLKSEFCMPDFSANNIKIGEWRPFQLAFILMNICGVSKKDSSERDIVDLIWFPTGGGKTEAYLGLAAFSIFYCKIKNPNETGTNTLMRYTLRLLTTQQFLRASSLICACEYIRRKNHHILGDNDITIGLWVGGSVSPNSFKGARSTYLAISEGKGTSESFVINTCPWCGAQMGKVSTKEGRIHMKGYTCDTRSFKFNCPDKKCDFHHRLPLQVVDQGIYEKPPTLLIGTVDKFVTLAWNQEALSLFGFGKKTTTCPSLIIQDELHLISGPLGSMVGLFESAIDALCKQNGNSPKIVASTATISKADSQIKGLYNREAAIFPPQGIDITDSFFAKEMKVSPSDDPDREVRGRAYVGIFGSARGSQLMTQAMLTAGLLQAAKSSAGHPKYVDPYFTIIQYYNSLRELGQAAATIDSEIKEHSEELRQRLGLKKPEEGKPDIRRYINRCIELASFIPSHEINDVLEQLFNSISNDERFLEARRVSLPDEKLPPDICFATNMIQVGLDVPRLGLMTVVGQPKGTAEYIQTTSRVGRNRSAPGLVFVTYNPSKPRDRSHYEHFKSYHQSLYRWVEPTCVTPYSMPSRERALHAVVVILVRMLHHKDITEVPPNEVTEDTQNYIKDWILKRVNEIDPSERNHTLNMLEEIFNKWSRLEAKLWGKMREKEFLLDTVPLLSASGSKTPDYDELPFMTPTSMRSVDATSRTYILD